MQSLLFLRGVTWFYGTAARVNDNNLSTVVVGILDKAQQLKDGPLPLSVFAQRRTELFKQGYAILESFANPCDYHEGFGKY